MNNSRRSFLTAIVPGGVLASMALLAGEAQQSKPTPPPHPGSLPGQGQGQQQPETQPQPPGAPPDTPNLTSAGRKALLTDDQRQIRKDVDELFGLAQDLKTQSEKMDSTSTLSIQFMEKTEEIEKLARKIRTLARG